jgi:N-methylhydantoinase A
VDVGGTFTDVVCIGADGATLLAKAATTPHDQSEGVLDGLATLAADLHITLRELLDVTERLVHGTTVATNALLERRTARVALLTTEGHRDVVEMREGLKPDRYDLRSSPPPPLVPRHLRLPLRERLRADGSVEIPLDTASLQNAIAALKHAEVDAVAICLLHAWRDGTHERAAAEAVRAALPQSYVTLSSEVLPQIKEYERFGTTMANAAVGPIVGKYLGRLRERLDAAGFHGPLFVILSHGGVAPVGEARRLAAGTALSGPAGGVAAALSLSRAGLGKNLVTFDVGGTSTDVALVADGESALGKGREIAGQRIALESLDIVTLGAGGGSLAYVDSGGMLRVGPRSAGAVPGPACYGAGGTEPAVTDANLLLGYLDGDRFLGGRRKLDRAAAEAAVARLAQKLGIAPMACAAGIHQLANVAMAEGIRVATVRRGVDPRAFTLLAFGGAAGLHASAVARDLGMTRVAVPLLAAGLSAWGMLRTDLRYEVSRSLVDASGLPSDDALHALFGGLEDEARARLATWMSGTPEIRRSADMRYGEQVFEIGVPLDGVALTADAVAEAFHARHEALFTYALRKEEVVLVTARVAAVGRLPSRPAPLLPMRAETEPMGERRAVVASEPRDLPVWRFDTLAPDQRVHGPAIVESDTTTVLLLPGDAARLDARGWLDVAVG